MALADENDLENLGFTRQRFGKTAGEWPTFVAEYLSEASIRLKKTVGSTIYADAESPTPSDADRALMLRRAEASLACSILALAWIARVGVQLGSFSAAHSSVTATGDTVVGLKTVAAQMVARHDQIVRLYKSTTMAGYAGYEPPED